MNIEKFKKIEYELTQTFDKKYLGLRNLLYYSSLFGNIMSILLAFFFLSKILIDSVTFLNIYVLYGISFIILIGLELFKRSLFTKFSLEFVTNRFSLVKREVFLLFLSSLTIIGLSFYSSLEGAREFTSKQNYIDQQIDQNINNYSDSITKLYNVNIENLQGEITKIKSTIDLKDKEQTNLSSLDKLNKNQLQRIKDIKLEKEELKLDIINDEAKIKSLIEKKDFDINNNKSMLISKSSLVKDKNKSNSTIFVIISMIIEVLILIGIYFDKNYKWISYTDHKHKINNDPNYQRWMLYDSILSILYINKIVGEKINSIQSILDTCKTNNIVVTRNEITDLLKLLTTLKILKLNGPNRTIIKDYDSSVDQLKSNFNVE